METPPIINIYYTKKNYVAECSLIKLCRSTSNFETPLCIYMVLSTTFSTLSYTQKKQITISWFYKLYLKTVQIESKSKYKNGVVVEVVYIQQYHLYNMQLKTWQASSATQVTKRYSRVLMSSLFVWCVNYLTNKNMHRKLCNDYNYDYTMWTLSSFIERKKSSYDLYAIVNAYFFI